MLRGIPVEAVGMQRIVEPHIDLRIHKADASLGVGKLGGDIAQVVYACPDGTASTFGPQNRTAVFSGTARPDASGTCVFVGICC